MISTFQAQILEKRQLTEHVYLLRFKAVDLDYTFLPGQYTIFHMPQGDGHAARRLYSMASPASQKDAFELIVEILPNGIASAHFMNMQIGETVTAQGPAGMFTLNPDPADSVFLATGTGIAPIRSMIYHLIENRSNNKIYLFWGASNMKDTYLFDEFKQLAESSPNFMFLNCISREQDLSCVINTLDHKYYAIGRVNDAGIEKVEAIANNLNAHHYYICGGTKMVEGMKEYLTGKAIPKEHIHLEKFTV